MLLVRREKDAIGSFSLARSSGIVPFCASNPSEVKVDSSDVVDTDLSYNYIQMVCPILGSQPNRRVAEEGQAYQLSEVEGSVGVALVAPWVRKTMKILTLR